MVQPPDNFQPHSIKILLKSISLFLEEIKSRDSLIMKNKLVRKNTHRVLMWYLLPLCCTLSTVLVASYLILIFHSYIGLLYSCVFNFYFFLTLVISDNLLKMRRGRARGKKGRKEIRRNLKIHTRKCMYIHT